MTAPPPPPPPASWMLFVESERRWSACVRAALRRSGRRVLAERVCRVDSPPVVEEVARTGAATLVGVEFGSDALLDRLELLWRLSRWPNVACVAMVPSAELRDAAGASFAEAGAKLAIGSPRDATLLIELHDRQAERWQASGRPAEPLARAIRRRLPWQSAPWAIG